MGLDDKQKSFIEEMYMDMYYFLSTYAQSSLNDCALAEEAVQDTFRIACAKIDDFISSPNPKGWLLNTLKYVIKNMVRSRAYINNIIITSLDKNEITLAKNTDELNIDIIYSDIVDSEDYKLLKRIALDKYTMLEAAQELGISVEACKKRVQRAKKKLKKIIKNKN
ncbi:sigma-70 family RNA polymerase sigma factor [Sedimentibacter sp.]|uniref:RNA polymerase sigma factor n=1 Tax=Sedimentibacter sp. TaxID=1960295 RepID=UPI0028AEFAB7|nr:sigma-70 family RNA polymerase sigma factor [Sedimentibacter sp.]